MRTFSESGLKFTFPDNWEVFQFDQHRFYQYVSGYGVKGVDFIGISNDKRLILVEVKNYFDRYPKDGVDPLHRILENPLSFAEQMIQKFEDSFSLINGIQQYYQRKTWFRWFAVPFRPFLPSNYILKRDWGFWSTAYQLLEEAKIDLVLWLEPGPNVSQQQKDQLIQKIKTYFKKEFPEHSIFVANREQSFKSIIGRHEN